MVGYALVRVLTNLSFAAKIACVTKYFNCAGRLQIVAEWVRVDTNQGGEKMITQHYNSR